MRPKQAKSLELRETAPKKKERKEKTAEDKSASKKRKREGEDEDEEAEESKDTNTPSEDSEDDGSVEEKWAEKRAVKQGKKNTDKAEDEDAESDSEDEDEAAEAPSTNKTNPAEEINKADATVFVGNVPVTAITSKNVYKSFKELWESVGEVASIRFRSIAFSMLLPRKAAFAKQKLHPSRSAANAYVVFANASDARAATAKNATVFEGHHLRVDQVAHPAKQDNKRCVFVGNLDFETDEEPLWRHFGPCGEIEHVRVVRDSKTNVGKGFCYVQFKDPVSVTKALLLNGKKLGDKGRELRVVRSKNVKEAQKQRAHAFGKPKNGGSSKKRVNMTPEAKTTLGRAKTSVGKAARAEISAVLEGTRAKKGDHVPGIKQGGKRKKPRIRERSTTYKTLREQVQKGK